MRKSSLFALCLFSFVSAFFISCEVGLGKAVDTSAPSVEIEAPEADFIVREKFVMSGVCSDDQGVVSIKVSLLNTTTHKSYGPFDAKLGRQNDSSETGEKSGLWKCDWTCEINPLDDKAPIPDGDYEATATAKDAYGHSTTGKKSFTIDNTPPLLVLTRPSTKVATDGSAQNFDTYGAEFDITGQVADDSNIDKLVVSVFSDAECKNLLTDIELKNVPPTIELSAAKWGAEESDELYGFYEKIYGSEKAGTKQFYCTVTVYDEARRCPSVENDEGNSRTAYYLYKDIYSALLNKYKVTELYHILNGSYNAEENSSSKNATSASNSSAFSVEKIAEEVNAILDSFETKAGSFTLNPENSPTFTLSGFDSFDLIDAKNSSEEYQKITEDDSGFGLLNGSAVTVKFSAGLDKSPLVEESLGFYLVPWIQNEADKTWSADSNDKIWIIRPYEKDSAGNYISEIDVSDFESGKQTEAKKYYENARGNLATVGSYDFTATMNIASSNLLHIKTGIVYELKAVGCDENGNSFLNDSRYGFYLESSGLAPSISVTEIDGKTAKSNWYVASGKSMKIKGTVSAEDKTSIKIKVTDDAKNTVAFEGEEIVCESSDSPVAESWELEIPNKYFASTKDSGGKPVSSNYTVNITATCGTRSTEKEISVGYDVEGPEIEIASVLPYASLLADESSGKNIYTVNGKFSVKVRASDSFYKLSETENIVLQIFDSDNPGNKNPVYYFDSSSSNFEKEIDSRSDLKDFDKHNLKIVVTAYDYAGNKTEVEQQIYLDQDTDKPVIDLQNAVTESKDGENVLDYTKEYPSDGTKNVFLSGAELSAKISDDDGIESIVVNVYSSPYKVGDEAKYSEKVEKSKITSNPYLLTYKLPTETEEFRTEIIVKDTENGTESASVFFLKIDSGAPTLKTFYQIQSEGSSENQKTEMQKANSVPVTKAYKFIYEASGNYGLSKTEPVKVKVYKTDSSGEATELDSSCYTNDFSLNKTDGKGGTGIISVSANSSGEGSQASGIQDDGTYSYEITVTDSNGKTSKAERVIVFDTNAPEVQVISPAEDTEWITTGSNRLSINGTASDDNGVKSVYYKEFGENESVPAVPENAVSSDSDWTKLGWKKANGTSSWKIADYELSEGSNRIAFAAVDIYGNCSCNNVRNFKYDGKSPEIAGVEVTKYSDSDSGGEKQENVPLSGISYIDKSVKKIKLKIEASDNLNLETLRVSVKKDGTETGDWKTADSKENLQEAKDSGSVQWTWTSNEFILGNVSTSSENSSENKLDDGKYEISVIVTDISGQTKTNDYSFILDTKAPEISSQTISVPSGISDNSSVSETGTWHSSSSPVLNVNASDATSGIASVCYMIGNSSLDFESLKKQTIDTPLTKSETEGTFRRSLSLNEGENYIYIKVEDNAGNFAYYGASDNGGSITWFVDKTGPVITFYAPNTSSDKKFSSKVEQAYEISVTDEKSGINESAEATLTLSSASATITKTAVVSRASTTGGNSSTTGGSSTAGGNSSVAGSSSSGGTFTVKGTFSEEEMSKITDNDATLTVSLKDACGNERTEKLTLTFDNEAPGVKIANPPSETVNGKITISGTSTDNVSVENVKLYRAKLSSDTDTSVIDHIEITENGNKTSVEAVLLQTFEGASAWNWSYSYQENGGTVSTFDTTKFSDGSAITLYAVALDTAGNTKTESKTLTVDQDADRPEIKFTNLTLNGMSSSKSIMNKNETIFGTVQDDDGVNEMFVSLDGGKTWSENIYDSGSWKYTFTEDESYKLEFKVIDSENREFVSGSGSDKMLSSPKLYDGSGNKFGYKNAGGTYSSDSDTYVYLQTDTQNPVINSVYYIVSENELSFSDDEIKNYKTSSSEAKKWQDKSNLSSFGGKYKYLYWLVDSQDASGISSVSASLGGTDLTLSDSVAASDTEKITVFKFDASSLVSVNSNLSVSYSVTDKAERKTSGEHNVRVDNAAPTIEIKSHKNNAQVYGSSSVNVKGIADDCEKLYVKVTDSSTTPDANFGSDTADKTQWERIDEYTSTGSWSVLFVFGSGTNTASGIDYYSKEGTLNGYYDKLFSPKSSEKTAGTKDMCIWLYGEDSLGNVSEPVKLALNVNPQGDQPNVSVSYPELSSDSKLTSVGGTIRITGSTSLGTSSDVTVDSVWIQIDPSYDKDAGFSSDWETELSSLMQAGGISETDYKIESSGISEVGNAIKAKGSTSSWNLTINASREFNPADNKNRTMAIRVYAYSSSNKVSNPVIVPFELDPNSPVIGGTKAVSLVQYDKDGKTVIREMPYSNNMWISGIWYLVGSAEDDSGISELKLNGESIIGDTSKLAVADDISSSTSCRNYYFSIPVGSETENAVGTLQYTLNATEGSADAKYTENTFSFQYDNKAPELKATDAGYKTELSSSGIKIIQSNGTYTVYGTLNEDTVSSSNQSGFSRVLMFFTRTLNGKNYVVDPMISSGSTGMENALDISVLGLETKNGIYWKSYTISSTNSNVLALSEELSKSVRIGGICRIDDIDYRISSIDYTNKTVTLDSSPSVSSSTTVAYFAIAQVIDNTSYENGTTSAFDFDRADSMSNADGDQMVEGVSQSGTTWKWSASIDSSLILDGAITMNFVAFDQAGNVSGVKQYSGTVSNNAPRIAGVMFGNDDDNNGTIDEDELVKTYSMIYTSLNNGGIRNGYISANQIADDVVIPSQVSGGTYIDALNIKGSFLVRPEIVGGNHGIGYNYKVSRGGTDVYSVNDVVRLSSVHSSGDEVRSESSGTKLDDIEISLEEMVSKGISDGSNAVFDFTLWDYTDGAEQSASSSNQANSARLRIYANVALYDEESPTVQINPFYWNSKDSNSVFYKDGSAKGHIELEDDWKNAAGYDSNATSGEYDGDPKVSGTIKIEGTASDNAMLKELYLTVPGLITEKLVGEYVQDETTKAWSWKEKGDLDTDGFACQIENTKFDNSGHSIKWTVTVNTERITNVAALDVSVQAKANDRGKLQYNSGKLSYAARTEAGKESSATSESYRMDVVPYITLLDTTLTDLEKKNPSVYGRTALGKYPVYYYRKTTSDTAKAESIIVKGFNIASGTVTFASDSTSSVTATLDSSNSFTLPSGAKSGEIAVSVNSVSSLNNINNNNAKGSYSGEYTDDEYAYCYNRQPNGQNNDLLTDNVELAIWEFNSKAAVTESGELSEVVMHVNPKNGMLGFAFAHSQDLASYPNGTSNSYETWMTDWTGVNQIGFTFDKNGNMFGTNGGTDTYTPNKKAGRFGLISSKWGIVASESASADQYSGYTNYRRLRLEYLGFTKNGTYASNVYRFAKGDCSQFATNTVSTTVTNLYMMYYDNDFGELKFKAGKYNSSIDSKNKTGFSFSKENYSFGDFADDAYNQVCSYNSSTDSSTYDSNYKTISIVANQSGANGNTTARPGIHYSIAVVPSSNGSSDVVVAIWYDDVNKTLWYSYLENPLTNAGNRDANGAISTEWATPVAILDGTAGGYCAIAVDDDNHIHIAAYSRKDAGSLYYAYLNSYNTTFNETTNLVAVDSYGSAGQYITMEFAKDSSGKTVPYIGYWMNSMSYPKYAYLVEGISGSSYTPKAGVDDENMYTGDWEMIMLPTSSSIVQDDINIGVYKNSSGTIQAIPVQTESAGIKNGTAGGNGTTNPILAYGIAATGLGYIETAQMK